MSRTSASDRSATPVADAHNRLPGDDDDVTPTPPGNAAPARDIPAALLPADPAAYDTERSAAARKRGLSTPYIPGGRDPDPAAAERAERRDLKILLAMVIAIVLGGFVIGLIAALLGLTALVGIPT